MKRMIFSHTFPASRHLLAAAALMALGVPALAQTAQTPMLVANVISATPAVQPVPVQVCGQGGGSNSGVGAAVGAITGGLIGSQFGRGNGHTAGAVLGAIGGAFVGDAAESQQRAANGCSVQYQNRVIGYDVVYELDGQRYQMRTATLPGQTIQVPAPGYGYVTPPPPTYAQQVPPQGDPQAYAPPPPEYADPAAYPPPQPAQPYYPAQQPYPPAVAAPGTAYPVYPAPAYPAYYPAPVVTAPPVGVSLSIGGVIGGGGYRGGYYRRH